MVVANPKHRKIAEDIWKLPEGTIPAKPGAHCLLFKTVCLKTVRSTYWVMCNNNMQAGPNISTERLPGYRNPDINFIVCSDLLPNSNSSSG
ncbi:hypothetical protein O9993_21170 [Vibrio lentus]|nr:hypothetical protein [Vibrio lentus]